ncbi:disease resistance RPP13-like protein 4 [Cryptomeria japonica]|uniref:disease resistance RPP13-like protein 4 n=1 Tax=Cryptomeria japonica TaxID=3369 RepID=UPI0027DA90CA|nr:disease resistance RPP13-like protein 4 [Cryptomeria japonica]
MESAMLGLVVVKLGRMMIEQINNEASLVLNFRKDFEWLSEKLTRIRSYLREADLLSAHNESVKRWLLDVAEIALDAEDILDECVVDSEGTDNESPQSSCVCALSYSQLVFRYIIESGSHPVAIESKVEQVLHLLNDPAALVIAVVGMGGVGKTFLMQNLFNKIKGEFEKSIWLAISQTYSLTKLQAALAMELGLNEVVNGRVDEVKAAELIHGRLASRKFLIVLDDVWRATEQENLVLALDLPRGNNSESEIVVTTRSKHVSSNMNARVYELQPWSKEESWTLFCAFAFQGNRPPHNLEGIACQVEGDCGRLPLAVKTVAASLANTTLSREWEFKLEQLRAESSTEDPIMQILKLSFMILSLLI